MKRTKAAAMLLAAGLLAAGTSAAAQEGGADFASLFYTYSKDNVISEYYDADYLVAPGELQLKSYDGFLALKQTDLNWDGTEELLAIRLKPQQDEEGQTVNTLLAEVYEYGGNTLQRIGQYTLAEDILEWNEARIDVFLVETQSGPVVCCEAKDTASVLTSGIRWSLRGAGFDGSSFYDVANVHLVGSSFTQEQMDTCWNTAYNLGFEAADIVWQPLLEQENSADRLCMISRYMTVDFSQTSAFIADAASDSMQYGETYFVNYANQGIENKLPGEFVSVLGTSSQDAGGSSEQTYFYEDDYVIADSSTRYITEEELQGLSAEEILLARNEIYAKHGRIFNNAALDTYFRSKSWYQPTVAGSDFTEEYASRVFNDFEIKNISTMVKYEQAHGLNNF
ncbi:MAG: YARHG domain-containing protein [Eubacteriales bacterium]|nr:YARHG domain-containing protein [Eubacteriales bacterium]